MCTSRIIGLMKRLSAQTKFILREPNEVSDDLIIGIDENYWGHGIETRLMEGFFSWVKANQIKRLSAELVN